MMWNATEEDFNRVVEEYGRYRLYIKHNTLFYDCKEFTKYEDYVEWKIKEALRAI